MIYSGDEIYGDDVTSPLGDFDGSGDETSDEATPQELAAWEHDYAKRVLDAALELDSLLVDSAAAQRIREILQGVAKEHERKALAHYCEHGNATSVDGDVWECDDCGREFTRPS